MPAKTERVEFDINTAMPDKSASPSDNVANILYIEDNPANLRLVQQSLGQEDDLRLYTAMTPASGLEQARRIQPNVILLDLNLHGMDGYSLLEELQNDEVLADIPVIAVTAQAMPWEIEKGQNSGFFAYLTKPVDIMALIRTIRQALKTSHDD